MVDSLRNPDGTVNREGIYELEARQLRLWVELRLTGDDPYLPLGRSEELPHTLLLNLFQAADPKHPFRERLHQVVHDVLEPVLTARAVLPSPGWLGEALRLAFAVRTHISRAILRGAFESGRFSIGSYGEAGIDVGLLDLIANQEELEPIDFWMGLVHQPRYALSAFLALERYGRDAVVQGIPLLIAAISSTPNLGTLESRVAFPLKRMVEGFGVEQLRPLLESRLANPDQTTVEGALRMVGIPISLERPQLVASPSTLTREQILRAIQKPEERQAFERMPLPCTPIRRGDGRYQLSGGR